MNQCLCFYWVELCDLSLTETSNMLEKLQSQTSDSEHVVVSRKRNNKTNKAARNFSANWWETTWEHPEAVKKTKTNVLLRTLPLTISQSGSSSPRWTQSWYWIFPRLTDTFTLTICCLLLWLSDSQPASWTSISENSNAFWKGWFRRQSKRQSEAVHWEPYLTAGILNLTWKAKTWKQVAGCITHHIF